MTYSYIFFGYTNIGDNMKNISIWKDTVRKKKFPVLDKDMDVDVLIVGGGVTGVNTLYSLRNSGLNVVLVEQGSVGMSTTANSTAKINFLQNDLLDKIKDNFGGDTLEVYLFSQLEAIDMIKDVIQKEKIDCDLEQVKTYLYTNKKYEISKIKMLERILNKMHIETFQDTSSLVESKYMIRTRDTYTFHPIKYIYGLLKTRKFSVYENTPVKKLERIRDGYLCSAGHYKIKAKWVVLATHYPHFLFPYLFPFKASVEKSYLSATSHKCDDISLISYSNPFVSIRNYKDFLLYLSNSHLVNSDTDDKINYKGLLNKLNDLGFNPDYLWSNSDVLTSDGLPYIGKIDKRLLIATGYNTWGFTNSFLAGQILSDIILGNKNKYKELFSPKRLNFSKTFGVITNTYNSLSGYVQGYVSTNKTNYKCTHLGCHLIYNNIEDTYDCPCHGSRFSKDGIVLQAPANKNIDVNTKK